MERKKKKKLYGSYVNVRDTHFTQSVRDTATIALRVTRSTNSCAFKCWPRLKRLTCFPATHTKETCLLFLFIPRSRRCPIRENAIKIGSKEGASVWYHTINRRIYNYFQPNTHTAHMHSCTQIRTKRAEMARRESLNNIWWVAGYILLLVRYRLKRLEKALTHSSTFLSYFSLIFGDGRLSIVRSRSPPRRLFFHDGIYIYISGSFSNQKGTSLVQSSILHLAKRQKQSTQPLPAHAKMISTRSFWKNKRR